MRAHRLWVDRRWLPGLMMGDLAGGIVRIRQESYELQADLSLLLFRTLDYNIPSLLLSIREEMAA
jgi:hypothetical protein